MQEDYRVVLRRIRENRGMSLSQTVSGIVSKSTMSSAELQHSSMSFENVLMILERLHVSPSELLARSSGITDSAVFINQLVDLFDHGDVHGLKHLLHEVKNKPVTEPETLPFHRLDTIAVQAAICIKEQVPLPESDKNFLMAYFLEQNEWFNYDLGILQFAPPLLDVDTVHRLADILFKNFPTIINSLGSVGFAVTILTSMIGRLIMAQDYSGASNLIARARMETNIVEYLSTGVLLSVFEAAIQYHRGYETEATRMFNSIVSLLKLIKSDNVLRYIIGVWQQLVPQDESSV